MVLAAHDLLILMDSRFRGNDLMREARMKKAVIATKVGVARHRRAVESPPVPGFPLSRG